MPDDRRDDRNVPDSLVRELHDHLVATGERPVETSASRYLGEAEAVVSDALAPGTPEEAVAHRVEQARDLLDHVEETGDDEADERVAAAKRLANVLARDLESDR